MPAQALYRKWRPQLWDEVVGQDHVVQTLRNALRMDHVAHAYLFAGPRGCGKTTSARLVAKAVNCLHPDPAQRPDNACAHCIAVAEGRFLDLIEIDGASNNGVENIRELREKINFAPNEGRYKVYVIDECFRYEDLITLADGSKLPIGKIVESGWHVEVLSHNKKTGRIEPKPVVRHMRKPPALPTVRVTFDNNRALVCTISHKFYTPQGLLRAGELEVGQFVHAGYERITQHQLEVAAGAAIGDSHLQLTGSQMRARLSITQGVAQKDYLDYKAQLLGSLVKTPPAYQHSAKSFSQTGTYRLSTLSRPQIAELHRELYDAQGRKHILRLYLDRLSPLGLALWYLDDGSLVTHADPYTRKDGSVAHYPVRRSLLNVQGFSLEEARLVLEWLQERWNIEGGVASTAKGPVIWLTIAGTEQLHEIIAAYVPSSMTYKLLPAYQNRFCPPRDDHTSAGLAVSVVRRVERVPAPDLVYNIEVADNHNYFARDILVANCHMLSTGAFNALLKTLEEPPSHAIFILATTESHKIPATVTSRCQRFEFRRISVTEMVAHLKVLCASEGIRVEEAALEVIARQATGSLRDAISLLDQLVAADRTITLAGAQALLGATVGESVQSLVDAVAAHDSSSGLALVNAAIDAGADPRQLARQVVDYLRGLMLMRLGSAALVEATAEVRAAMARQAQAIEVSALLHAIRAFNAAANDVKGGWQPQLPLEMAIVECATPPMSASPPAETEQAARPPAPEPLTRSQAPEAAATQRTADVKRPTTPVEDSDLRARWSRLLTMMHAKDKPTEALLRSCTVLGLHGTTLRLSANEFVSKQINDNAETRQRIEVLLAEVLGFPCAVKCQRADRGHSRRAAVEDIPHDGMVATALDLGGEIVE